MCLPLTPVNWQPPAETHRRAQQSADKQKARRLRRNGHGEWAEGAANSGVVDPGGSSDGVVAEDADLGYGGGTDASDRDEGGGDSAGDDAGDDAGGDVAGDVSGDARDDAGGGTPHIFIKDLLDLLP